MSTIFGIFSGIDSLRKEAFPILDYWNGQYLSDQKEHFAHEKLAMGCGQLWLRLQSPKSSPVLKKGRYISVIDAVLFNREELIKETVRNAEYISDEMLLFEYVLEKGRQNLNKVNGDFAGVIYDSLENTFTVFRDHMGVRPLFYYKDDETFVFSTDLRAIAAIPGLSTGINESMLFKNGMGYNMHSAHETSFENIYMVEAGCSICIYEKDGCLQEEVERYWSLGGKKISFSTEKQYEEALYSLVEDAIRIRADVTDGLIGCELSGGLDSGVVSAFLVRMEKDCSFYSWSPDPEEFPLCDGIDERKVILDFCRQKKVSCQFQTNEIKQSMLEKTASLKDMLPPYFNTVHILEGSLYFRTQGARIVFTGHGGDEGISHRSNPYEFWYRKEYASFFKYFFDLKKGKSLRFLRALKAMQYQITRVNRKKRDIVRNSINVETFMKKDFVKRMESVSEQIPLYFSYDAVKFINCGGSLPRLLNMAFQGGLAGVQYMVPYLDYRVIDFAVSIPAKLYLDAFEDRKIYRHAFKELMPSSLADVDYKSIPSIDSKNAASRENIIRYRDYTRERLQTLGRYLDDKMWDSYLELDLLRNVDFSDAFTADERELVYQLDELYNMCILVQDILLKGRDIKA